MSKRDQWRKTVEAQLSINDNERQSVRRIMSRLRGNNQDNEETSSNTPSEIAPVQKEDRSENKTGADSTLVQAAPVSKSHRSKNKTGAETTPVPKTDQLSKKSVGYLKIPNEVLDNVLPKLSPAEAVVLIRLYRLALGFNQYSCTTGFTALTRSCNISENTCRVAIRRLLSLGLIEQLEIMNTKEIKGTTYKICTGVDPTPVQNLDRSKNDTGTKTDPNTHDDDDLNMTDHHHSAHARATMTIYQSITGNDWTKADQLAYEKIKAVPTETIDQGIKVASARANSKPNSLAYFVKEILSLSNPTLAPRNQRKREIKAIVERVRTASIGANLPLSELAARVKDICAKDGVFWDNDLFNEIVEKDQI